MSVDILIVVALWLLVIQGFYGLWNNRRVERQLRERDLEAQATMRRGAELMEKKARQGSTTRLGRS